MAGSFVFVHTCPDFRGTFSSGHRNSSSSFLENVAEGSKNELEVLYSQDKEDRGRKNVITASGHDLLEEAPKVLSGFSLF